MTLKSIETHICDLCLETITLKIITVFNDTETEHKHSICG